MPLLNKNSVIEISLLEEMLMVSKIIENKEIKIEKTSEEKCDRCWRYDGNLCDRCSEF